MPLLDVFDIEQIPDVYVKFTASQGLNATLQGQARSNIGAEAALAAGTVSQYYRGDKTWQTLNTSVVPESGNLYFTEARVRATLLTGYVVGTNTALAAGDSHLTAFGKIQAQINGKANASHTHAISDITSLQATLDGKAALSHTHAIADVTGLQTALDGKAAASHTHDTSAIVSGILATARLSGTYSINITGNSTGVVDTVTGTNSKELVRGNMADNDQFRILVGGTASNAGFAEIATADDGTEPIHVRQYTGAFATLVRTATLLDGSGNSSFPGSVTASSFIRSGGTSAQFLKADGSVDSTVYVPTGRTITINGTTFDLSANRTWTISTGGTGTVTSVSMTVPTGLSVAGSPITGSGTLAVTLQSGYSIPTTASQTNWDTAFGWGNHAGLYALASHTHSYLPLAGGTLSGILNMGIYDLEFTGTDPGDIVWRNASGVETHRLWIGSGTLNYRANSGTAFGLWHSGNLNPANYALTTGSNASGTWGINISGTASISNLTYNVASGAISDLNSAWTAPGTSIDNGFRVFRYSNASSNMPVSENNANWLINIYSHPSGGTASYGHQLAAADTENIYFRKVTNGSFGSWRALWHTGNFNPAGYVLWTDVAESGASKVARYNNQGYLLVDNWIRVAANTGFYSSTGHYFFNVNASYNGWVSRSSSSSHSALMFQNVSGTSYGAVYADSAGDIGFTNSGLTAWRLRIDSSANGYFGGDVIAFTTSDKRLKENIKKIPESLDKIRKIGGYSFDWSKNQIAYTGKDYGVIAQEVEGIFPEMVTTRKNGYKAVKYDRLIPVLIEAVRELSSKVETLEKNGKRINQ